MSKIVKFRIEIIKFIKNLRKFFFSIRSFIKYNEDKRNFVIQGF